MTVVYADRVAAPNGAATARTGAIRAAVFHGSDEFYRRNGIEGKLRALGLDPVITRDVDNAPATSLQAIDVVVFVIESSGTKGGDRVRQVAAAADRPVFGISYRRSDPTWAALSEWAGAGRAATGPVGKAGPGTKRGSVAESVAETEQLAAMYQGEADELRLEVEGKERELVVLRGEMAGASATRERLTADLARAQAERTTAVRDRDTLRAELTAAREAAEREGAEGARDGAKAIAVLRKVTLILGAVREDVLTEAEAMGKIRAVIP